MKVEIYSFEAKDGSRQDFTTMDPDEARRFASDNHLIWIANIFEFADSELVEDYSEYEVENEE